MKKTIFATLLLSAGILSAQAQISAGNKLLTGSISYSRKSESVNSFYTNQPEKIVEDKFSFAPSAGYFVTDNVVVGLTGGIFINRKHEARFRDPTGLVSVRFEEKNRTLSGGLFGRYYKFLGEKVAMYGQLGASYQNTYYSTLLYTNSGYTKPGRSEGLSASLAPGLVFFPTSKIGLELAIRGASYNRSTFRYTAGNSSSPQKNTSSNLDFGFGLDDLNLGISLYLGRD
ncbi:hypothetical protein J7E24_01795 [Hymenobacter sp. ISL-91]|uniref:hypothetical protein n=1 Tax=Hymenobacter sp. ISL-91 TaxID=2819151 RepID=UPI001BE6FC0B|nr:hypothetical protein [Hymenobacter sp. ISL-91]MBT2556511.1 hypothetical protein [Hymenobacter sp. ISL-91]